MAQTAPTETPRVPPPGSLIPSTVGEKIRFVRERRGMKQRELARRMEQLGVKISPTMLSRFERYGDGSDDQRRPQITQLLAMATVLEVNLGDLGVNSDTYPEIKFLRDAYTLELLRATPPYLNGKRTTLRARPPRRRPPRKSKITKATQTPMVRALKSG